MRRRVFSKEKQTLNKKLFAYMFLMAAMLLALFIIGIFLVGGYTGVEKEISDTLQFQTQVFARQVKTHYDGLAVMGVQLSENAAEVIEDYLADSGIEFEELNDSEENIAGVQELLIEQLKGKLVEADSTGVFIMLNVQVNTGVDNAQSSRSGIYLQKNSLDSSDTRILLYRGLAKTGKDHGAMPHRKWRLEFDTGLFPNYEEFTGETNLSVKEAYRVSDVVTLPGTSERVMLLTVPVIGQNGTFYGICGFEVSESYFKYTFSQPSEMEHTIFCLTRGNVGLSDSEACLSAGVADGYYMAPDGEFESRLMNKHGLVSFESDSGGYVGTTKSVRMSPRGEMVTLSTLMPRHDYDGLVMEGVMRIVLLIVLFLMIAVWCCVFFSKRYLNPLLASMEQIRQKEYRSGDSQFKEIEELTKFLAQEEQRSEAELEKIRNEKAEAEAKLEQLRQESDREIKKLACYGKNEVDAEEYMYFCRSIDNLTETERRVFDYYAQGKKVKEIMELMGVKESTIRFHNRNIYATLGVSSLKQLLRFAAIMRQDNEQIDEKES